MKTWQEITEAIMKSRNIQILYDNLVALEAWGYEHEDDRAEIDAWKDRNLSDLPVFAGGPPESTYEVLSWDHGTLLIAVPTAEVYKIVRRFES